MGVPDHLVRGMIRRTGPDRMSCLLTLRMSLRSGWQSRRRGCVGRCATTAGPGLPRPCRAATAPIRRVGNPGRVLPATTATRRRPPVVDVRQRRGVRGPEYAWANSTPTGRTGLTRRKRPLSERPEARILPPRRGAAGPGIWLASGAGLTCGSIRPTRRVRNLNRPFCQVPRASRPAPLPLRPDAALGESVGQGRVPAFLGPSGGPVTPCHRPGAPQSGNQRVRSCSMRRSSLSTALACSSSGPARLLPGSGANG